MINAAGTVTNGGFLWVDSPGGTTTLNVQNDGSIAGLYDSEGPLLVDGGTLVVNSATNVVNGNTLISSFANSAAPHGGLKRSGIGRTHGILGLQEMIRPRYLDVDLAPRMKKPWWYPYSGRFAPLSAFGDMVHAPSLLERLTAAIRSLPALFHPRR